MVLRASIPARLIAKAEENSRLQVTYPGREKRKRRRLSAGTLTNASHALTTDMCNQVALMLKKTWSVSWSLLVSLLSLLPIARPNSWSPTDYLCLKWFHRGNVSFLRNSTWSQGRRKHSCRYWWSVSLKVQTIDLCLKLGRSSSLWQRPCPWQDCKEKGSKAQWSSGAAALRRLVTHNRSLQCSAVTRGTVVVRSWEASPDLCHWLERTCLLSPSETSQFIKKEPFCSDIWKHLCIISITLLLHNKLAVLKLIIEHSPASFWNVTC